MSESPKSIDERDITLKVFNEFLAAKGVREKCYQCGNENFGLLQDEIGDDKSVMLHGAPRLRVDFEQKTTIIPTYIPVIHTICHNCGHIVSYLAEAILRWMNNRGE